MAGLVQRHRLGEIGVDDQLGEGDCHPEGIGLVQLLATVPAVGLVVAGPAAREREHGLVRCHVLVATRLVVGAVVVERRGVGPTYDVILTLRNRHDLLPREVEVVAAAVEVRVVARAAAPVRQAVPWAPGHLRDLLGHTHGVHHGARVAPDTDGERLDPVPGSVERLDHEPVDLVRTDTQHERHDRLVIASPVVQVHLAPIDQQHLGEGGEVAHAPAHGRVDHHAHTPPCIGFGVELRGLLLTTGGVVGPIEVRADPELHLGLGHGHAREEQHS